MNARWREAARRGAADARAYLSTPSVLPSSPLVDLGAGEGANPRLLSRLRASLGADVGRAPTRPRTERP